MVNNNNNNNREVPEKSNYIFVQFPHKEDDATDPWTFVAKHKLQVEHDLKKIPNLAYTILRPAIVYGLGDKTGLGHYFKQ